MQMIRALALGSCLIALAAAAQTTPKDAPAASQTYRAQAASSDLIFTTDASRLAVLLREQGFSAEVSRTSQGQVVFGKIEGVAFQATPSSCQAGAAACTDVELYARFPDSARPKLEMLNGWNNRTRYARAFVDPDGVAALQMDVGLSGGVSAENLAFHLELWGGALTTYKFFLTKIGGPAAANKADAKNGPAAKPNR
jgi:hypothetical protein